MLNLRLFNKGKPYGDDAITETIERIKNGDNLLKEKFIQDYRPFIIKVVSRLSGKYIDTENNEEFSIGLLAFNEAIERYDKKRNDKFLIYSEQVIRSRLIDFARSNMKNSNVYPFTYFESEDNNSFEERYLRSGDEKQFENIEIREELMQIHKELSDFGISLKDLVISTPKHRDSKQLCIRIARILACDNELYEKMMKKKNIPKMSLARMAQVDRKTIERNRSFIIAVSLILKSGLETMKGYIEASERGGRYHD